MRKIPTLFKRDPDDMRHVLPEVTPDCEWVLAGEGVATRKYDGTCVRLTKDGLWWARREVKPGKTPPANFVPEQLDEVTGKTVGWEPAEQSGFYRWLQDALAQGATGYLSVPQSIDPTPPPGSYELLGPKINRNTDCLSIGYHILVMHGYEAYDDRVELAEAPRDFAGLREWMLATRFEGIVWHHPDGRMAKLKARDFR